MIDNFEKMKQIMGAHEEGCFYFLQIIIRRKDNPEIGCGNILIKAYYIEDMEHLTKKEMEIKKLCHCLNARAYIHLSRRNYEKVAKLCLKKMSDVILNNEWKYTKEIYNSACGECSGIDKSWIIDVDFKDEDILAEIRNDIRSCDSTTLQRIYTFETPDGYHLITVPFNLEQFEPTILKYKLDVHKNNPTVLYYKESNEFTK